MMSHGTIAHRTLVFVQINDVYHIDSAVDPRDPQTRLLPRVATVIKRLKEHYGQERVVACLPGDFLAPSCLSREFDGAHMVSVLKQVGVSLFSVGNHEFDVGQKRGAQDGRSVAAILKERRDQSAVPWLLTNIDYVSDDLNPGFQTYSVLDLSESTKLIMIGLLTPGTKLPKDLGVVAPVPSDPQKLDDRLQRIVTEIAEKGVKGDPLFLICALTHLDVEDDLKLAENCPQIHVIMGGHDHDVVKTHSNQACLILKAAANAQTIRLNFAIELIPDSQVADVRRLGEDGLARLVRDVVDEATSVALASDPSGWGNAVLEPRPRAAFDTSVPAPVVFASRALDTCSSDFQKLVLLDGDTMRAIDSELAKMPPELATVVATSPLKLDLTERTLRSRSTPFGILTCEIMRGRFSNPMEACDAALLPGGTFRLDRYLEPGEVITQRVLCDIFYYESQILEVVVPGALIVDLVNLSRTKTKSGEFLQVSGLSVSLDEHGEAMLADGSRLDMNKDYRIALLDYMMSEKSKYFQLLGELRLGARASGNLRARVANCVQRALDGLASDPAIVTQGWYIGTKP